MLQMKGKRRSCSLYLHSVAADDNPPKYKAPWYGVLGMAGLFLGGGVGVAHRRC